MSLAHALHLTPDELAPEAMGEIAPETDAGGVGGGGVAEPPPALGDRSDVALLERAIDRVQGQLSADEALLSAIAATPNEPAAPLAAASTQGTVVNEGRIPITYPPSSVPRVASQHAQPTTPGTPAHSKAPIKRKP